MEIKSLKELLESNETKYPLEGYIHFKGIPIEIENKKGSIRSGKDKNGKEWSIKMNADYGRIPMTEDSTNEMMDIYVGDNKDSDKVFVVKQLIPETKEFDELKWLLGFNSKEEAIKLYKSQYNKLGFFGGIKEYSFDKFKSIVFDNIIKNISNY